MITYISDDGYKKEQEYELITKETIISYLERIKSGYLPDWNYESIKDPVEVKQLPNEYYPFHLAMEIAIDAIEKQDEDFFRKWDNER